MINLRLCGYRRIHIHKTIHVGIITLGAVDLRRYLHMAISRREIRCWSYVCA